MKKPLIIFLAAVLVLSGCGSGPQKAEKTVFAMDTVMQLTAYGSGAEEALAAAEAEIFRLDALLDRGGTGSEIAFLNYSGGGEISPETAALIEKSLSIADLSGGCFDPTVAPVMDLWGFYGQEPNVPGQDEIDSALALVDYRKITVNGNKIDLDGARLDLGGIGKGYASAQIMEIFREHGVSSGLVSLGGNVQALGSRPDGSPWRVGVQNPDGEGFVGVLLLSDEAAVTSGDYQRRFEQDGKVYHHIIDPSTGFPAESGLCSVTVVCADGALADGLSTALFVMGRSAAVRLWRERGDFQLIMVENDGTVYITAPLEGSFEPSEGIRVKILN